MRCNARRIPQVESRCRISASLSACKCTLADQFLFLCLGSISVFQYVYDHFTRDAFGWQFSRVSNKAKHMQPKSKNVDCTCLLEKTIKIHSERTDDPDVCQTEVGEGGF